MSPAGASSPSACPAASRRPARDPATAHPTRRGDEPSAARAGGRDAGRRPRPRRRLSASGSAGAVPTAAPNECWAGPRSAGRKRAVARPSGPGRRAGAPAGPGGPLPTGPRRDHPARIVAAPRWTRASSDRGEGPPATPTDEARVAGDRMVRDGTQQAVHAGPGDGPRRGRSGPVGAAAVATVRTWCTPRVSSGPHAAVEAPGVRGRDTRSVVRAPRAPLGLTAGRSTRGCAPPVGGAVAGGTAEPAPTSARLPSPNEGAAGDPVGRAGLAARQGPYRGGPRDPPRTASNHSVSRHLNGAGVVPAAAPGPTAQRSRPRPRTHTHAGRSRGRPRPSPSPPPGERRDTACRPLEPADRSRSADPAAWAGGSRRARCHGDPRDSCHRPRRSRRSSRTRRQVAHRPSGRAAGFSSAGRSQREVRRAGRRGRRALPRSPPIRLRACLGRVSRAASRGPSSSFEAPGAGTRSPMAGRAGDHGSPAGTPVSDLDSTSDLDPTRGPAGSRRPWARWGEAEERGRRAWTASSRWTPTV